MEFKDNIKKRRQMLNLTLEEVARQVDVNKTTVQRWESGRIKNIRQDKITKLAQTLQTSPAVLMGWNKNEDIENNINVIIPHKKAMPLNESTSGHFIALASSQEADFCFKMPDNSMHEAGIMPGDLIFVRKQHLPQDGSLVAIEQDGQITLRRFYRLDGGWQIQAAHPNVKPRFIDPTKEKCLIYGQALSYQRDL